MTIIHLCIMAKYNLGTKGRTYRKWLNEHQHQKQLSCYDIVGNYNDDDGDEEEKDCMSMIINDGSSTSRCTLVSDKGLFVFNDKPKLPTLYKTTNMNEVIVGGTDDDKNDTGTIDILYNNCYDETNENDIIEAVCYCVSNDITIDFDSTMLTVPQSVVTNRHTNVDDDISCITIDSNYNDDADRTSTFCTADGTMMISFHSPVAVLFG